MEPREIEALVNTPRTLYPHRYLAVYRERDFFVIHNLLTQVKRYYTHANDVAQLVKLDAVPGTERRTRPAIQ